MYEVSAYLNGLGIGKKEAKEYYLQKVAMNGLNERVKVEVDRRVEEEEKKWEGVVYTDQQEGGRRFATAKLGNEVVNVDLSVSGKENAVGTDYGVIIRPGKPREMVYLKDLSDIQVTDFDAYMQNYRQSVVTGLDERYTWLMNHNANTKQVGKAGDTFETAEGKKVVLGFTDDGRVWVSDMNPEGKPVGKPTVMSREGIYKAQDDFYGSAKETDGEASETEATLDEARAVLEQSDDGKTLMEEVDSMIENRESAENIEEYIQALDENLRKPLMGYYHGKLKEQSGEGTAAEVKPQGEKPAQGAGTPNGAGTPDSAPDAGETVKVEIPKDEKTGELKFEAVPAERTIDYLYSKESGLSDYEAYEMIQNKLRSVMEDYRKAYENGDRESMKVIAKSMQYWQEVKRIVDEQKGIKEVTPSGRVTPTAGGNAIPGSGVKGSDTGNQEKPQAKQTIPVDKKEGMRFEAVPAERTIEYLYGEESGFSADDATVLISGRINTLSKSYNKALKSGDIDAAKRLKERINYWKEVQQKAEKVKSAEEPAAGQQGKGQGKTSVADLQQPTAEPAPTADEEKVSASMGDAVKYVDALIKNNTRPDAIRQAIAQLEPVMKEAALRYWSSAEGEYLNRRARRSEGARKARATRESNYAKRALAIEAYDLESIVQKEMIGAKFIWDNEGGNTKGLGEHLFGHDRSTGKIQDQERRNRQMDWLASREKGGLTPEEFADKVWQHYYYENEQYTPTDILNVVLDTLRRNHSYKSVLEELEQRYRDRDDEEARYQKEQYALSQGFDSWDAYVEFMTFIPEEEMLNIPTNEEYQKIYNNFAEQYEAEDNQLNNTNYGKEGRESNTYPGREARVRPDSGRMDADAQRSSVNQGGNAEGEGTGNNNAIEVPESTQGRNDAKPLQRGSADNGGRSSSQADGNQIGYKVSERKDSYGLPFVLTKEGKEEFGEITEEVSQKSGLPAAPILFSEGKITNEATKDGFGLVHVVARHGSEIKAAGYESVIDFVKEVATDFDKIRLGNVKDGKQTYLLQKTDTHDNTLIVELSNDGKYWYINTAGIFKESYGAKKPEIYNRHTTVNQSAETDGQSLDAEQGGTPQSTSMVNDHISGGKGTNNSANNQIISKKNAASGDVVATVAAKRQQAESNVSAGMKAGDMWMKAVDEKTGDAIYYREDARGRRVPSTFYEYHLASESGAKVSSEDMFRAEKLQWRIRQMQKRYPGMTDISTIDEAMQGIRERLDGNLSHTEEAMLQKQLNELQALRNMMEHAATDMSPERARRRAELDHAQVQARIERIRQRMGEVKDRNLAQGMVDQLQTIGMEVSTDIAEMREAEHAYKSKIDSEGVFRGTDAERLHKLQDGGNYYGFVVGGKIYLDPRKLNPESVLHEYTHLWASALRIAKPKVWLNIVEMMKKDETTWDYVKQLYPELNSDEAIADEVLARYSGKRGAQRLQDEMSRLDKRNNISDSERSKMMNAFNNIKKAIQDFWKNVGSFLQIDYKSAEEVADQVLKDFVSGTNVENILKKEISKLDGDYLKAVENGDEAKATELFNEALRLNVGNGTIPYISAAPYLQVRNLAHKVKSGDAEAIKEAAQKMAPLVPANAVLIPIPSRTGKATNMLALANAIAEATGAEVKDILTGESRESLYEMKKRGATLALEDLGIKASETIPSDKIPIFIDNVVDTGLTAEAAVKSVGRGIVLTLGSAVDRYKHSPGLKFAKVVVEDKGRVIPLSERFTLGKRDIRYHREDVSSVSETETIYPTSRIEFEKMNEQRMEEIMNEFTDIENRLDEMDEAGQTNSAEYRQLEDRLFALDEEYKGLKQINRMSAEIRARENDKVSAGVMKTEDGKKVAWVQLSLDFDENDRESVANQTTNSTPNETETAGEAAGTVASTEQEAIGEDLTQMRLRPLKAGERSYVERRYVEDKGFSFTGGEKITSPDDVAYIFRSLEDSAVENTFFVLLKGGKATIIHAGMGDMTGSMADGTAARLAIDNLKPDAVVFVHNHPSGKLTPSLQDRSMHKSLVEMYGGLVRPSIIIDQKSGRYATFNDLGSVSTGERPTSVEDEVEYNVFSFSKNVFAPDYKFDANKIGSSEDIAAFISSQRLGDRKKLGVLIMSNNMAVNGNVFLPYDELTRDNLDDIAEKITSDAAAMSGKAVVLFGSGGIDAELASKLKQSLKSSLIVMMDAIKVAGNNQYTSLGDEGVMEEGAEYGGKKTPEQQALLRGLNFREYPTIQEYETKEVPSSSTGIEEGKLAYINKVTLPSESSTSTQGNQLTLPAGAFSDGKDIVNNPNYQTNEPEISYSGRKKNGEEEKTKEYRTRLKSKSMDQAVQSSTLSGTKVEINPENRKGIEENLSDLHRKVSDEAEDAETFLVSLRKSMKTDSEDRSGYNTQTINGKLYTLRISDHFPDTRHLLKNNENDATGITVVISVDNRGRFRADDDAKMIEYVFNGDDLNAEKQRRIVEAIQEWLETGHTTIDFADYVHKSPKEITRAGLERNKEYEEAVKNGDMEKAKDMLAKEAHRKNYFETSDYQGKSAFNGAAPSAHEYYDTPEESLEAWENEEYEGSWSIADELVRGIKMGDLENRITARDLARGNQFQRESIQALREAMNKVQNGEKNPTVKVYRSVPKGVREGSVRNGDWVTLSKSYAIDNAEIHFGSKYYGKDGMVDWGKKDYNIIEMEVPIEDLWWDGNDINEFGYDNGKEMVYRNTTNNAKLLEPTYDNEGNLIPLSERFNKNRDDVRFMEGENKPTFYSNAEKAVMEVKQEKATAEQWLKMIQKGGGLKAEEDKWMGLSEWLASRRTEGNTVTKQEILDFIRENSVQVEEVKYAQYPESGTNLSDEVLDLWRNAKGSNYDKADAVQTDLVKKYGERVNDALDVWYDGGIRIKNQSVYDELFGRGEKTSNIIRINYTTEGLKNKKEIALVVPGIEPWNQSDNIHFGDAGEGRAVAWIRFGETIDKDGKRVLVIDEIQSKRHQEGREKGYKDSDIISAKEKLEKYVSSLNSKYGNDWFDNASKVLSKEEYDTWDALWKDANGDGRLQQTQIDKVPDAPFRKNWHELAMKRMLRYAAENGYDKIAWTTGTQQAERYDIGKSVDEIRVIDAYDGNFTVEGYKDGRRIIERNAEGEKGLAELIGKDMARKAYSNLKEGKDEYLTDEGYVSLTGDNLTVGGEGMKGFYDKMLPQFMDKYGKKWGVKTGEVELDLPNEGDRKMWSVDVTPEMKKSVMGGQPMFMDAEKIGFDAEKYDEEHDSEFGQFLEYFRDRKNDQNPGKKHFVFGDTGDVLHQYGMTGKITIDKYVFNNRHSLEAHELNESDWVNIALSINEPIAISRYKNRKNSYRLYTTAVVNGKNICVGVDVNRVGYNLDVTNIRTAFGRDLSRIVNSDEELLYTDENKIKQILNQFSAAHNSRRYDQESVSGGKDKVFFVIDQINLAKNADATENFASQFKNADIAVIRSADELNQLDIPESWKEQIKNGKAGFYDVQGKKSYVYMPNVADEATGRKAVMHEAVAHYGLRELIGHERFDKEMLHLLSQLPSEVKKEVMERAHKMQPDATDLIDWAQNRDQYRAAAMDEYLADHARDAETPKWWDKVKGAVRNLLRNLGFDMELTDGDVKYMLWRSAENLRGNRGLVDTVLDKAMRLRYGVDAAAGHQHTEQGFRGMDMVEPEKHGGESDKAYEIRLKMWRKRMARQTAKEEEEAPGHMDIQMNNQLGELTGLMSELHKAGNDGDSDFKKADAVAEIVMSKERDLMQVAIDMQKRMKILNDYELETMKDQIEHKSDDDGVEYDQRMRELNISMTIDAIKRDIRSMIFKRRRNIEVSNLQDSYIAHDIKKRMTDKERELMMYMLEGDTDVLYEDTPEYKELVDATTDYLSLKKKFLDATSDLQGMYRNGMFDEIREMWKLDNKILKVSDREYAARVVEELQKLYDNGMFDEMRSWRDLGEEGKGLDNKAYYDRVKAELDSLYRSGKFSEIREKWSVDDTVSNKDYVNEVIGQMPEYKALKEAGKRLLAADDALNRLKAQKKLTFPEHLNPVLDDIRAWFDNIHKNMVSNNLFSAEEHRNYVNNYCTHIWERKKGDEAKIALLGGQVRLISPYAKTRLIMTYSLGKRLGLVPKYNDITDIMLNYGHYTTEVIENRQLVSDLRNYNVVLRDKKGVEYTTPLIVPDTSYDSDYVRIDNNAMEGWKVYKAAVKDLNVIFGKKHLSDNEMLQKAGYYYDVAGGFMKKVNLSMSFFHHNALMETGVGMLNTAWNPFRFAKVIAKNIAWDAATKKDLPAFTDREAAADAVKHFVSLGATQDYAAADVKAFTKMMRKTVEDKEWKKWWAAKGVTVGLDVVNEKFDMVLWDCLHDGLKIYSFKKMADEIRKRGKKENWTEVEIEAALDEAGQLINDTYGGQHWDLLGMSQNSVKWLRRLLLSPDWTVSTIRQALSPFGIGQLYNDDNFWKKWRKADPVSATRRRYGRYFWFKAAAFYVVGMNLQNMWIRYKDEEEEKEKAEERRKYEPDYKSPYELAYPEGMKWYDYTMYGNTLGHQTHLFWGHNEDGTETYVRWGKQFREMPELFWGREGFSFPGAMLEKMAGKVNPMLNTMVTLVSGNNLTGWTNKYMKNKVGIERDLGRLQALGASALPYVIDDDFQWIDLVMPSSKGMSSWKARSYFETAIRNGDMNLLTAVYRACVLNGLDPDKLYSNAISNVESDIKSKMISEFEDVNDAAKAYDAETNRQKRAWIADWIKKQEGAQDYHAITMQEMSDRFENGGIKDGELISDTEKDYLTSNTSEDILQDWRITKAKKGLQEWHDQYKKLGGLMHKKESSREAEKYRKEHKEVDQWYIFSYVTNTALPAKKKLFSDDEEQNKKLIEEMRKIKQQAIDFEGNYDEYLKKYSISKKNGKKKK